MLLSRNLCQHSNPISIAGQIDNFSLSHTDRFMLEALIQFTEIVEKRTTSGAAAFVSIHSVPLP